jgi:hypothetical protein
MWCIGQITGEYLARMEDVLSLYHLPADENRPVICLDELPYQMLGEKAAPLPIKSGALKKFDYEYERGGVASVFVAFEPLTGKRLVKVYRRRTKADYCRFAQEVVNQWAEADVIICVQDNLNTHNASSFYVEHQNAAVQVNLPLRFLPKRFGIRFKSPEKPGKSVVRGSVFALRLHALGFGRGYIARRGNNKVNIVFVG